MTLALLLFSTISNGQNFNLKTQKVTIIGTEYACGQLKVHLNNTSNRSEVFQLQCELLTSETSEEFEIIKKKITVSSGPSTIAIKGNFIHQGNIKLIDAQNITIAQNEVSDGTWRIINQEDLFMYKVLKEERSINTSSFMIERSLVVVPRMYNRVLISRNFNDQNKNVDLSAYSKLRFESKELEEVQIDLVTSSEVFTLNLFDLEDGVQEIDLSQFVNDLGLSSNLKNIERIDMNLKGYGLALPITMSNFELLQTKLINRSKSISIHNRGMIYPNVSNGEITFQLENASQCNLKVMNEQGMILFRTKIDDGSKLDLSHLPKGKYYCKIYNDQEDHIEKIILL